MLYGPWHLIVSFPTSRSSTGIPPRSSVWRTNMWNSSATSTWPSWSMMATSCGGSCLVAPARLMSTVKMWVFHRFSERLAILSFVCVGFLLGTTLSSRLDPEEIRHLSCHGIHDPTHHLVTSCGSLLIWEETLAQLNGSEWVSKQEKLSDIYICHMARKLPSM